MISFSYSSFQEETNSQNKWVRACNIFGQHLMEAARDYAFSRIPKAVSEQERETAEKAALDAIYGVMMLFDGVVGGISDEKFDWQYLLKARVISINTQNVVEEIELSPNGDGLCMGYHGWTEGDFGDD